MYRLTATMTMGGLLSVAAAVPVCGQEQAAPLAEASILQTDSAGPAQAGTVAYPPPVWGDCGMPSPRRGCGPIWYCEFESMFMGYQRAGGVTNNAIDARADFDYALGFTPRSTVGMILSSGLGLRARGFVHDQGGINGNGESLEVSAIAIDLEFFENIALTGNTAVEWSLGGRGVQFEELTSANPLAGGGPVRAELDGFGLEGGLEVNRMLDFGSIYGRGRGALLMGDREIRAPGVVPGIVRENDVASGQLELAVGWEFSHACSNGLVLTAGVGWEFQQWFNYSIAAPADLPAATPIDVGFQGVIFNFALGF